MKRLLAVLAVLVAALAPVGRATADRIALPAPTTLDCATQASPSITSSRGEYRVTGTCDKLTISGTQNIVTIAATKNLAITGGKNEVTVDRVDKIAITGPSNRVTYKAGLAGPSPKVAATQGNLVRRAAR